MLPTGSQRKPSENGWKAQPARSSAIGSLQEGPYKRPYKELPYGSNWVHMDPGFLRDPTGFLGILGIPSPLRGLYKAMKGLIKPLKDPYKEHIRSIQEGPYKEPIRNL